MCKNVTSESIKKAYADWTSDPKKAGGILLLGHEIRDSNLELTKGLITEAKAKGWKVGPITLVNDKLPWYVNSADGTNLQPVDSLPVNKKPFDVSQGGKMVTLNSDYTAGGGAVASGAETGNQSSKTNAPSGGSTSTSTATNSSSTTPTDTSNDNTATSTDNGAATNTTGASGGTTSDASTANSTTTVSGAPAGAVGDVVRAGMVATGAAMLFAGFLLLA